MDALVLRVEQEAETARNEGIRRGTVRSELRWRGRSWQSRGTSTAANPPSGTAPGPRQRTDDFSDADTRNRGWQGTSCCEGACIRSQSLNGHGPPGHPVQARRRCQPSSGGDGRQNQGQRSSPLAAIPPQPAVESLESRIQNPELWVSTPDSLGSGLWTSVPGRSALDSPLLTLDSPPLSLAVGWQGQGGSL